MGNSKFKREVVAIILASGTGQRFLSEVPKQFMKLAGKSVLEHTLDVFQNHSEVDRIVVVISDGQRQLVEEVIVRGCYGKVTKIVKGGSTRQESSAAGVSVIEDYDAKVLVHDSVRPLVDSEIISRCLDALDRYDAVDTGVPSPDTIVRVDASDCIEEIPDRAKLRLGQTPQAFRAGLLLKAHELAKTDASLSVTDDCGLILRYGLDKVYVVAGDISNIKITYPSDIYLADRLFQVRSCSPLSEGALDKLTGKVLVVFGASEGIGKSIVKLAKDCGASVVSASRSNGVDVTDSKVVRAFLNKVLVERGSVDYIVNSAGVLRVGLLAGQGDDVVDEQILTNFRGSVVVAREGFSVMRKHGGAIALFTSSSYTRGRANFAVYSATKAAVVNLMQGLAEEYLPFNVRVNAINPERTATRMRFQNFGQEPRDSLLDAEVVAKATLFSLVSDSTGQVLDVRR